MSSVFNVRWPDTNLESRLKALAVANSRSLHAEVLVALERYVGLAVPAVVPEAVGKPEVVAADYEEPVSYEDLAATYRAVSKSAAEARSFPKVKLSKEQARQLAAQMGYKKTFKPDFK